MTGPSAASPVRDTTDGPAVVIGPAAGAPGRLPGTLPRLRPVLVFCLVGLVNTGVSYVAYLGLRLLMPYLVAYVLGWAGGVVVSFLLNCRFTYRVRPTWRGFVLFPLSSLPNIVLSSGGVVLMVEVLGWDQKVAPLIATLLAVPVSYLIARTILVGPVRRIETAAGVVMSVQEPPHTGPVLGECSAGGARGRCRGGGS
ncbi:GtrA family protein [Raineyella sp. W15-4]|uniref:GtrA family protein n=1 Tax=Raineyella sp. W15-4 TaxID=3081651 RepID=UPI002954229A|nr:GtrA family protein [Raineyella sp. W15-4]WOQ16762.1 GtrA family protein [Raineyella sp. W15-4]